MDPATTALFLIFFLIKYSYENYTYETKYIAVPVDHFSFSNNASFKLRYLINDTYWDSDGPIFFYTGNEGDINVFAQNTGFIWDIAREFDALVVFAEHRYYGESLPFGNKSFLSPTYLGYLTSSQALADYIYLIDYLQTSKNFIPSSLRNPVIVFGGSYGGMLAAWMRMKYPGSVLGAIASSAPIYQFQGLTSCDIYNRILTNVFKVSSHKDCPDTIRSSWPAIRRVASTANGRKFILEKWKLCDSLQTNDDVEKLINWLTDMYSNLAMANYPYPANFLAPLPAYPVTEFCSKLNNDIRNDSLLLQNLGTAINVYANYTGTTKCINLNQSSSNIGEEVWEFQACTEIIMPMCSDDHDMFENQPWNFTKFSADCYKKFKVQIKRPDIVVLEYGGKNIKAASNIVFSNGLLDPWSGGGVLQNISKTVLAVLIPDGAHHIDLRGYNSADPSSVTYARNFHRHAIHHWLRGYYSEANVQNGKLFDNYINEM